MSEISKIIIWVCGFHFTSTADADKVKKVWQEIANSLMDERVILDTVLDVLAQNPALLFTQVQPVVPLLNLFTSL